MKNLLECHGTLTALGCGCLVETTYNVIVEKHPASRIKIISTIINHIEKPFMIKRLKYHLN